MARRIENSIREYNAHLCACTEGFECLNNNCYYCSRQDLRDFNKYGKRGHRLHTRTCIDPYLEKFVCFDCKSVWKQNKHDNVQCTTCKNPATEVGRTFRAPKKTSNQWAVLKLMYAVQFKNLKHNTLAAVWEEGGGYNGHVRGMDAMSSDKYAQKLFYVPKTIKEIPEWIEYMKETEYRIFVDKPNLSYEECEELEEKLQKKNPNVKYYVS